MKTYKIAAIPADGIGTEVIAAGIQALEALAKTRRRFRVFLYPFRLGFRPLQANWCVDARGWDRNPQGF